MKINISMLRSALLVTGAFASALLSTGCSTDSSTTNYQPISTPSSSTTTSSQQDSSSSVQLKTPATYTAPAFKGNACTGDCSGHEAGYNWAEEKGIDDPSDCGGNSNSFIEGCETYAQEQQDNSSYGDNEDYAY